MLEQITNPKIALELFYQISMFLYENFETKIYTQLPQVLGWEQQIDGQKVKLTANTNWVLQMQKQGKLAQAIEQLLGFAGAMRSEPKEQNTCTDVYLLDNLDNPLTQDFFGTSIAIKLTQNYITTTNLGSVGVSTEIMGEDLVSTHEELAKFSYIVSSLSIPNLKAIKPIVSLTLLQNTPNDFRNTVSLSILPKIEGKDMRHLKYPDIVRLKSYLEQLWTDKKLIDAITSYSTFSTNSENTKLALQKYFGDDRLDLAYRNIMVNELPDESWEITFIDTIHKTKIN